MIETYGQLPLNFEPNRGQTDSQVKFLSRARGYTLFLTSNEAVLRLRKASANLEPKHEAGNSNFGTPAPGPQPLAPSILRMRLVGANPTPEMSGVEELPGKSNYFIGRDSKKWQTGIPNFRKVAAHNVYPGIDLVYYGSQRQLEYDFTVAPGADPRAIRLAFETGSSKTENRQSKIQNLKSKIAIDANGDLVIGIDGSELRFRKPVVYQEQLTVDSRQLTAGDNREPVDARYVLRMADPKSEGLSRPAGIENPKFEVAFAVGPYDTSRPLIIDPVLSYSTYLGGSDIDSAKALAVDSHGSAYLVGQTDSRNFPTAHALQPALGGGAVPALPNDAFITKLTADGSALAYSTFIGGALGNERANAIAVDSFGIAYVVGTTNSADFPVTLGAFDTLCGDDGICDATVIIDDIPLTPQSDAFVLKLNSSGSALVYSTYLGAFGNDEGAGIAVDNGGSAFVTGNTAATNFPITPGAFQAVAPANINAFVSKVDPFGVALVYSTYLGGSSVERGTAIAADSAGNAYVTGLTVSADFPTTASALQLALAGGGDAFLTKINGTGTALAYSTFLGGSDGDQANGIALDAAANVYLTGQTSSTNFPVSAGVLQPTCALNVLGQCDGDVFVTKLDTTQAGVASRIYATYLGGTGADSGADIDLDPNNNAYVTGFTNSLDFPTLAGAFQPDYGGGNSDAFVFQMNLAGTALVYSSYLGGPNTDTATGIGVDLFGSAYVAGETCESNPPSPGGFPTTLGVFQPESGGNCDAFASKVIVGPDIVLSPAALSFTAQDVGTTSSPQTITVTSNGDSPLSITSVAINGEFSETDNCSAGTLGVGEKCTIDVTFSPTTPGPKSGTVTITDNALGSPHSVPLSGGTSGVTGDYALSVDPKAVSVIAGSTANVALAITPVAGFTSKVTLACTGAPREATCSVTPASLTLDGVNASQATVSVTTGVRTVAPPGSQPNLPLPQNGLRWLPLAFLLMILVTMAAAGRRRTTLVLGVVILMSLLWTACGGGGQVGVPRGTPAGVYTLTISGVSGTATKTTTVTLTVN